MNSIKNTENYKRAINIYKRKIEDYLEKDELFSLSREVLSAISLILTAFGMSEEEENLIIKEVKNKIK